MTIVKSNSAARWVSERMEILAALGILMLLGVMVIPIHPTLLDILLTTNITMALLVLLLSIYVKRPIDMSIFPTLLLVLTLFRLGLNVASTRLILLNAHAGDLIEAFGSFVVGGNYAVGVVAYFIIAVIQFVVITKGTGRIAEVAARFTLDAMPGRQMSIDADLSAGIIDEGEAKERRETITAEADFYGAMDGATKFVRGDAVAGIIITVVNVLGGLIVGSAQLGMPLAEAARTYTLLTIGDGLVAQIPALVTSTAAGLLVTRSGSAQTFGEEFSSQLFNQPMAMFVAGSILGGLGLIPGLPTMPFMLLAIIALGSGVIIHRSIGHDAVVASDVPKPKPEISTDFQMVDPIEIEVGYGLIPLVDESQDGDLLERVTLVRRQLGLELGVPVPSVRIRDNVKLGATAYRIMVHGVELGTSSIMLEHCLAIPSAKVETEIEGISTTDPVFGLPAIWVPNINRERAAAAGYSIVDTAAVIATHLTEILRGEAASLLGRQETQEIIDQVKETAPALIEELVPNSMSLGAVQQVLRELLKEKVSIRDMRTILETLADYAPLVKDVGLLTEAVRRALGPSIWKAFEDDRGKLSVVTLDPLTERTLAEAIGPQTDGRIGADLARRFYAGLREVMQQVMGVTTHQVILTPDNLRRTVRDLVAPVMPHVAVLAISEVARRSTIEPVGQIVLTSVENPAGLTAVSAGAPAIVNEPEPLPNAA